MGKTLNGLQGFTNPAQGLTTSVIFVWTSPAYRRRLHRLVCRVCDSLRDLCSTRVRRSTVGEPPLLSSMSASASSASYGVKTSTTASSSSGVNTFSGSDNSVDDRFALEPSFSPATLVIPQDTFDRMSGSSVVSTLAGDDLWSRLTLTPNGLPPVHAPWLAAGAHSVRQRSLSAQILEEALAPEGVHEGSIPPEVGVSSTCQAVPSG